MEKLQKGNKKCVSCVAGKGEVPFVFSSFTPFFIQMSTKM